MSDDRSEVVPETERPELPPVFQRFIEQLKTDRKQLMREKAYGQSPDQLRAFMGQFLFARLSEMVELMGLAIYDTYSLAVSNANQQQRTRAHINKQLRKLGAEIDEDDDEKLPGVGPEVLDELQQAFYGLGSLLEKKLPNDKDVQEAFNRCAQIMSDIVAELMGQGGDDDEDDDEDEDEEDEEEGEEAEASGSKREKKKEKAAAAPEAEASKEPGADA